MKHFLIFAVTCALIQPSIMAQEQAASKPLSLKECVGIALRNQQEILLGGNAVIIAKEKETQAKSSYWPQVTAENSNTLVKGGTQPIGQTNGTSLTVTQNFYDGGLREAGVTGARAGVAQNQYALMRTSQTVTFDVTSAYYALLRAVHLADVSDAQVKYLMGQLELVQARVSVGSAAEADTLPVQASLANAKVNQLSAQNAVKTAAITLQNVMGLAPVPGFVVEDITSSPTPDIKPMDKYIETALSSRPDIQQSLAVVRVAQASLKATRINLYPKVFVNGQYGAQLTGLNPSDPSAVTGSSTLLVLGGVTYDLFDGLYNRAAYRQAKAAVSNAQIQACQLTKDVRANVEKAYLDLLNAKERLAASEVGVASAQKNFDAQSERYKQGLAIPLDLLNAQSEVVTAEGNAVQARYDFYTSVAQLEYAVGKQGSV